MVISAKLVDFVGAVADLTASLSANIFARVMARRLSAAISRAASLAMISMLRNEAGSVTFLVSTVIGPSGGVLRFTVPPSDPMLARACLARRASAANRPAAADLRCGPTFARAIWPACMLPLPLPPSAKYPILLFAVLGLVISTSHLEEK